jgi:hypothetical protein
MTVEISDDAAQLLERRARHAKVAPAKLASKLLTNALEVEQFSDGQIKAGCDILKDVLLAIPTASDWKWSGVNHRHWWVSLRLNERGKHFTKIIRTLGAILNTDVLQSWGYKPFVFTPEKDRDDSLCWQITTLVSMVDPVEVAEYLRERLPDDYQNNPVWDSYEPH